MVQQPVDFSADSVVVITGCSRGLGLEFVKQLLETTESHVVATARNPQKSDALTGLSKQYQKRLKLVTLNTEDESSIKVLVLALCWGSVCAIVSASSRWAVLASDLWLFCCQAAVQEVGNAYSGVDLLINNAGVCESVEEPVMEM